MNLTFYYEIIKKQPLQIDQEGIKYHEINFNKKSLKFVLNAQGKPTIFVVTNGFEGLHAELDYVSPSKILLTNCCYVSDSGKSVHIIFEEGYRIISIYNATNNNTRYIIDKELGDDIAELGKLIN